MNKDDVRRLAREAGAAVGRVMPDGPEIIFPNPMDVYLFASLVAEQERKEIIAISETDEFQRMYGEFSPSSTDLVNAIKARDNQ